ncbi:MAG: molybdopterin biosynthesis protein [Oscillospiraceae bacterium]|nr:molybdopterin biosynthesis protein [Oscillospiraceae bacterium]MBR4132287.1 molybdopterin biosynthesis protein [Oscillospiraceae bacterium]
MAFRYLTNTPLEEARENYVREMKSRSFAAPAETIPVQSACGRVTARAVYAAICAPHYPASAMDGIALDARKTFGAGETTPVTLAESEYTVVDTGDPIPEGCDAVVMVEDLVPWEGGVRIYAPSAPWQNIRQVGEDICAGEMILPSHAAISPAAIGAMLAAGVLEVSVLRRPVVGILPTGDEVVPPTENPGPGDVIEFNSAIFSAMLAQWGAEARAYLIVPDDRERIRASLAAAVEECDVVLLNAGSSAGREDLSAEVIGEVGEVLTHGVAMKPGKPAILGCVGSKPVLGVPGYPVSGILVLTELLKPLLDLWYASAPEAPVLQEATLSKALVSGLKYREFVRVRLGLVGGRLMASPLNRGSGVVSSFMKADGILEVPQGTEGYEAGQKVSVRLLRPMSELSRTLVAVGSHDPLLDEAADLLHLADPALFMSSTHVGSMGGIMAVRRGETHVAGVHLLDEADGSYNVSYIRKHFPKGGVRLVECVGRTQGLMLAPGNPLGIRGLEDLSRPGLRYVNRQKGSGTRILIDYLCKRGGIDTAGIYGYEREEFTHTSVAAQIASGSADAGMGIWSAARLYGLDFLPVCMEQYDLLIPDEAFDTPMVQRLLEVLKSDAFRARMEALGGYRLEKPGSVRQRF